MTSVAFIIGTLIIGLCLVAAAFIISGSITGAAASAKESAPQSLQQPTLSFLTEFDAADYLGISLNELDYMRSEGMLENTFVAVTSMEQTGEEEYYAMEDGVEVIKVRPVMSPVTRFLFNRQLLDERMLDIIKQGQHVNPTRPKNTSKPKSKNENRKNGQKNGSRPERRDGEQKNERRENEGSSQNGGKKHSDRPENSDRNNNNNNNGKKSDRPGRDGDNRPKKSSERHDSSDKTGGKSSFDDAPVKTTKPSFIDDDDEIFAKPAKSSSVDDDFFSSDSKASITIGDDDDDAFDLDVFGRGDVPAPSSKFDRRRND